MATSSIILTFKVYSTADTYYAAGSSRQGSFTKKLGRGAGLIAGDLPHHKLETDPNITITNTQWEALSSGQDLYEAIDLENEGIQVRCPVSLEGKYGAFKIRVYAENDLGLRSNFIEVEKQILSPDIEGTYTFGEIEADGGKLVSKSIPDSYSSGVNNIVTATIAIPQKNFKLGWSLIAPPGHPKEGLHVRSVNEREDDGFFMGFEVKVYKYGDGASAAWVEVTDAAVIKEAFGLDPANTSQFSIQTTGGNFDALVNGATDKRKIKIKIISRVAAQQPSESVDRLSYAEVILENTPPDLKSYSAEVVGANFVFDYEIEDEDFSEIRLRQYRQDGTTWESTRSSTFARRGSSGSGRITMDQRWSNGVAGSEFRNIYRYAIELYDSFGLAASLVPLSTNTMGSSISDVNAKDFEAIVKIGHLKVAEVESSFNISWSLVDSSGKPIELGDADADAPQIVKSVAGYFSIPGSSLAAESPIVDAFYSDGSTARFGHGDGSGSTYEERGNLTRSEDSNNTIVNITKAENAEVYKHLTSDASAVANRKLEFTLLLLDGNGDVVDEVTRLGENEEPKIDSDMIFYNDKPVGDIRINLELSEIVQKIKIYRRPHAKVQSDPKWEYVQKDLTGELQGNSAQAPIASMYNDKINETTFFGDHADNANTASLGEEYFIGEWPGALGGIGKNESENLRAVIEDRDLPLLQKGGDTQLVTAYDYYLVPYDEFGAGAGTMVEGVDALAWEFFAADEDGVRQVDDNPPGGVENLEVTGAFETFFLSWDAPTDNDIDRYRITAIIDKRSDRTLFDLETVGGALKLDDSLDNEAWKKWTVTSGSDRVANAHKQRKSASGELHGMVVTSAASFKSTYATPAGGYSDATFGANFFKILQGSATQDGEILISGSQVHKKTDTGSVQIENVEYKVFETSQAQLQVSGGSGQVGYFYIETIDRSGNYSKVVGGDTNGAKLPDPKKLTLGEIAGTTLEDFEEQITEKFPGAVVTNGVSGGSGGSGHNFSIVGNILKWSNTTLWKNGESYFIAGGEIDLFGNTYFTPINAENPHAGSPIKYVYWDPVGGYDPGSNTASTGTFKPRAKQSEGSSTDYIGYYSFSIYNPASASYNLPDEWSSILSTITDYRRIDNHGTTLGYELWSQLDDEEKALYEPGHYNFNDVFLNASDPAKEEEAKFNLNSLLASGPIAGGAVLHVPYQAPTDEEKKETPPRHGRAVIIPDNGVEIVKIDRIGDGWSIRAAWHAFANAVIGSAHIGEAAILDAHINTLTADKITGGKIHAGETIELGTDNNGTSEIRAGTFSGTSPNESLSKGFQLFGNGEFIFKTDDGATLKLEDGQLIIQGATIKASSGAPAASVNISSSSNFVQLSNAETGANKDVVSPSDGTSTYQVNVSNAYWDGTSSGMGPETVSVQILNDSGEDITFLPGLLDFSLDSNLDINNGFEFDLDWSAAYGNRFVKDLPGSAESFAPWQWEILPWESSVSYKKDAYVRWWNDNEGPVFKSLTDSNSGNTPPGEGVTSSYWVYMGGNNWINSPGGQALSYQYALNNPSVAEQVTVKVKIRYPKSAGSNLWQLITDDQTKIDRSTWGNLPATDPEDGTPWQGLYEQIPEQWETIAEDDFKVRSDIQRIDGIDGASIWYKWDDTKLQTQVSLTSPGSGWAQTESDAIELKGGQGDPLYTWIMYANDANGTGLVDTWVAGKNYIGIKPNNVSDTESTTPGDYSWTKIEGVDGASIWYKWAGTTLRTQVSLTSPGSGWAQTESDAIELKGSQGNSLYTWIKYANDANGTGLVDTWVAGKNYIGIAYNETSDSESQTAGDYSWTKIEGADGTDGLSVYITYNDNSIDNPPSTPTGDGTTPAGWHTAPTSDCKWMSQRVGDSLSAPWDEATSYDTGEITTLGIPWFISQLSSYIEGADNILQSSWSAGVVGSGNIGDQFTGEGYAGINGDANIIEIAETPSGEDGLVWVSRENDSADDGEGGWRIEYPGLNANKRYLSVVYIKVADEGGYPEGSHHGIFYHGTAYYDEVEMLGGVGNSSGNPYFSYFPTKFFPEGVWCVSIGFIHPYNTYNTGVTNPYWGGVYRLDTGAKLSLSGVNGADFQWTNTNNANTPQFPERTGAHRAYLYYDVQPPASSVEMHFYAPGLFEVPDSETQAWLPVYGNKVNAAFESKIDNNVGNSPPTDGEGDSNWENVDISDAETPWGSPIAIKGADGLVGEHAFRLSLTKPFISYDPNNNSDRDNIQHPSNIVPMTAMLGSSHKASDFGVGNDLVLTPSFGLVTNGATLLNAFKNTPTAGDDNYIFGGGGDYAALKAATDNLKPLIGPKVDASSHYDIYKDGADYRILLPGTDQSEKIESSDFLFFIPGSASGMAAASLEGNSSISVKATLAEEVGGVTKEYRDQESFHVVADSQTNSGDVFWSSTIDDNIVFPSDQDGNFDPTNISENKSELRVYRGTTRVRRAPDQIILPNKTKFSLNVNSEDSISYDRTAAASDTAGFRAEYQFSYPGSPVFTEDWDSEGSEAQKFYKDVAPSTNILSMSSWVAGSVPSSANVTNLWAGANYARTEGEGNFIETAETPYGDQGLVWVLKENDVWSDSDGGWKVNHLLNGSKRHLSIVYVKVLEYGQGSDPDGGHWYHGGYAGYNLERFNGAGVTSEPYFEGIRVDSLPLGVWCVNVGYIHPYGWGNLSGENPSWGGLYRLDTCEKISPGVDFQHVSGWNVQNGHRCRLVYDSNPAATSDKLHLYDPGIFEVSLEDDSSWSPTPGNKGVSTLEFLDDKGENDIEKITISRPGYSPPSTRVTDTAGTRCLVGLGSSGEVVAYGELPHTSPHDGLVEKFSETDFYISGEVSTNLRKDNGGDPIDADEFNFSFSRTSTGAGDDLALQFKGGQQLIYGDYNYNYDGDPPLSSPTGHIDYALKIFDNKLAAVHNLSHRRTVASLTQGTVGEHGTSTDIIFRRSAGTPTTPGSSPDKPDGWHNTTDQANVESGVQNMPLWSSAGTKVGGGTDFTWQAPVRVEGSAVAEVKIYQRSSTDLGTPGGGTWSFVSNSLTTLPSGGWSTTIPADTDARLPCYVSIALADGVPGGVHSNLTWTQPVILVQSGTPGPKGNDGVTFAYKGEWNSRTTYTNGSIDNSTRDLVTIRGEVDANGDPIYRLANATITASGFENGGFKGKHPSDDDFWGEFVGQYESMATGLLLSQDIIVERGVVTGIVDGQPSFIASQLDSGYFNIHAQLNSDQRQDGGDYVMADNDKKVSEGFVFTDVENLGYRKIDNHDAMLTEVQWVAKPAKEQAEYEAVPITLSYQYFNDPLSGYLHDKYPNTSGHKWFGDQTDWEYYITAGEIPTNGLDYATRGKQHWVSNLTTPDRNNRIGNIQIQERANDAFVNAKSNIRSYNQKTYKTPNDNLPGYFLGYIDGEPKMELYRTGTSFLRWDGSKLIVKGAIIDSSVDDVSFANIRNVGDTLGFSHGLHLLFPANYDGIGQVFVGGGFNNRLPNDLNNLASSILGGANNRITGTLSYTSRFSSIAGGYGNMMIGNFSSIGGGYFNKIEKGELSSIVGGARNNVIDSSYSLIGGGYDNLIEDAKYSSILNGQSNTISELGADQDGAVINTDQSYLSGGFSYLGWRINGGVNPFEWEWSTSGDTGPSRDEIDEYFKHFMGRLPNREDDEYGAYSTKVDFYADVQNSPDFCKTVVCSLIVESNEWMWESGESRTSGQKSHRLIQPFGSLAMIENNITLSGTTNSPVAIFDTGFYDGKGQKVYLASGTINFLSSPANPSGGNNDFKTFWLVSESVSGWNAAFVDPTITDDARYHWVKCQTKYVGGIYLWLNNKIGTISVSGKDLMWRGHGSTTSIPLGDQLENNTETGTGDDLVGIDVVTAVPEPMTALNDYSFNSIVGGDYNTIRKSRRSTIVGGRSCLLREVERAIVGGLDNMLVGQEEGGVLPQGFTMFGKSNIIDHKWHGSQGADDNNDPAKPKRNYIEDYKTVMDDSSGPDLSAVANAVLGNDNRIRNCSKIAVLGSNNDVLFMQGSYDGDGNFQAFSESQYKPQIGSEITILGTDNKIAIKDAGLATNLGIFGTNFILSEVEMTQNTYYIGNPKVEENILNLTRVFVAADGGAFFTGDIVAFALSDEKHKENILTIDSAIDKIMQIRGITFDWKKTQAVHEGRDVGVLAQEVEKVLPEVVEERTTGKAVRYEKIVPLLIEAIKEQQIMIEELRSRIDDLQ